MTNRRDFMMALSGVTGAVLSIPSLAKAKADGKHVLVLPEKAAAGDFVTVVHLGNRKWGIINHSPVVEIDGKKYGKTEPWRIEEL